MTELWPTHTYIQNEKLTPEHSECRVLLTWTSPVQYNAKMIIDLLFLPSLYPLKGGINPPDVVNQPNMLSNKNILKCF